MHRSVDVLPAPLGPIRPTISPEATSNDTRSTATASPYRLVTSCRAITRLPGDGDTLRGAHVVRLEQRVPLRGRTGPIQALIFLERPQPVTSDERRTRQA